MKKGTINNKKYESPRIELLTLSYNFATGDIESICPNNDCYEDEEP
ncbi:MAG: hypothetical protein LBS01_04325 [Prevotellaceae bacterium]|jgi:hypothetical protein|nr:hypothetical protein [Prevotellaceae bacterium]